MHWFIGNDFKLGGGQRYSDAPIEDIMDDVFNIDVAAPVRPDLADLLMREAYEIKPNRSGNGRQRAEAQLKRYINTFNQYGVALKPGASYDPPKEIPSAPGFPDIAIFAERPFDGVILYTLEEKRERKIIEQTAESLTVAYTMAYLTRLASTAVAAQNAGLEARVSMLAFTRGF